MQDATTAGGHTVRQTLALVAPQVPAPVATLAQSATVRRNLNFDQVRQKLGVSERTARKIIAESWFPDPIELGPRCLRWIDAEIDEALAARAPRRAEPGPEPAPLLRGKIERAKREGVLA